MCMCIFMDRVEVQNQGEGEMLAQGIFWLVAFPSFLVPVCVMCLIILIFQLILSLTHPSGPGCWRTGRIHTLTEVSIFPKQRTHSPGLRRCFQILQDVPEEVYRRPSAQGHLGDLSPRGEGSAWAEEVRRLPGAGVRLAKGEPEKEEHQQWVEAHGCGCNGC